MCKTVKKIKKNRRNLRSFYLGGPDRSRSLGYASPGMTTNCIRNLFLLRFACKNRPIADQSHVAKAMWDTEKY